MRFEIHQEGVTRLTGLRTEAELEVLRQAGAKAYEVLEERRR